MKSKIFYFVLLLSITFIGSKTIAQTEQSNYTSRDFYFGLGLGMDYGGIGLKAEFLPSKYMSVFAGVGYALIDPAYNVGISGKLLPENRWCPTIQAMYGYNAIILISNRYYSEIYYGPTVGAGVEYKVGKRLGNKLSLGLFVPFRNSTFRRDYDELRDAGVQFSPDILPITFSFGVNFGTRTKTSRK